MSDLDRLISALRASEMLRLGLIGALTLVLFIPLVMIGGLVSEREARYLEAADEISSKWGGAQTIAGPAIVLPYEVTEPAEVEGAPPRVGVRFAVFLPRELRADAHAETEVRARGIFSVPVYTLNASVEGTFDRPDPSGLGIDQASVLWDRARFVVGIADVRAISDPSDLTWNGQTVEFLPGAGEFYGGSGIHAPVAIEAASPDLAFAFSLSVQGSRELYFGPFAEETTLRLASNSEYPSFQGNWLPTDHVVSESGFEAVWGVSYLGRNYPQSWLSTPGAGEAVGGEMDMKIAGSLFGVRLGSPVDHYRMAERSVKYGGLFILLTFALVWVTEILARARIHPIQYLMLGAALAVFYLLELSLAEHIGFHAAYAVASLSILGMVAGYGLSIFRSRGRAALVAAGVAALYAFLFVLLTNQDRALLVGSVGVFAALGSIMFVTRRVDWYRGASGPAAPGASGE